MALGALLSPLPPLRDVADGRVELERLCRLPDPSVDVLRVVVIAAHPDDDVLGASSRLRWLGKSLRIVYASNGAPENPVFAREAGFDDPADYAARRSTEAREAVALGGIAPEQIQELWHTDQTLAASLVPLTHALIQIIRAQRPEIVLSHPYEGGHPDHDAAAFAVHAARRLLARVGDPVPALLEFACYFERDGGAACGEFHGHPECPTRAIALSDEDRALKLRMLACHATQERVWRWFPLEVERFRVAPHYDFTRLPEPPLYYERFDWNMDGARFIELARAAHRELGLETQWRRY